MTSGRRINARANAGESGSNFQAAPGPGVNQQRQARGEGATDPKLVAAATSMHRIMRLWAPAIRQIPGIGPVFSNSAIVLGRAFATSLAEMRGGIKQDLRENTRTIRAGAILQRNAIRAGWTNLTKGNSLIAKTLRTMGAAADAVGVRGPRRIIDAFRTTSTSTAKESASLQRRAWDKIPDGITRRLSTPLRPLQSMGRSMGKSLAGAAMMGRGMTGMAGTLGKMMPMMAGVLGAVVAIAMLSKIFRNILGSVFGILGMFMDLMIMPFMPLFMLIIGTLLKLQPSIMKIVGVITMLLDIMMPLFLLTLEWIITLVDLAADIIVVIANLLGAVLAVVVPVLTVISGVLLSVVQAIVGLLMPALVAISQVILDLARFVGDILQWVADKIVAGFQLLATFFEWLGGLIGGIITWLGDMIMWPLNQLVNGWNWIMDFFSRTLGPVFDTIASGISTIVDFFRGLGGGIMGVFGFQQGAHVVPQTGPALVHRGEMIIPQQQAGGIRTSGGANVSMQNVFNITNGDPRQIASDIQVQLSRAMILDGVA